MRTVPCAVTCERYWAGKQSGLCQDFTPTVPAQRKWPGKGAWERGGEAGSPAWSGPMAHHRARPPRASHPPASLPAQSGGARMSRQQDGQREASPESAALQRGAASHCSTMQGLGVGAGTGRGHVSADTLATSESGGATAPAPGTKPSPGCRVSPAGLCPGGLAQGQARLGGWAQPGAKPPLCFSARGWKGQLRGARASQPRGVSAVASKRL